MTGKQIILAVILPVLWGFGFTLAKIGLDQFSTMLIMALRFGIAALVLLPFAKLPHGRWGAIFVIALVSATLQYGLTFNGLRGLDASTAIIIIQLEGPFLMLLGVIFLRERPGLIRYLGIALAFAGVVFIAGQPRFEDNMVSILLVASGSMIWAFGQFLVSRVKDVDSLSLVAWVSAIAAPQMAVVSWLLEDGQLSAVQSAGLADWAIVIYLGVIMTSLGYSIWYYLLQTCDVSRVGPFLLLLPVTTISTGVLLRDEIFDAPMMIGAALVIGGLGINTFVRERPKAASKPVVDSPAPPT